MKSSFLLLISVFLSLSLSAQLVVTDPPLPLVNQPVTVIFDATQGSGGLAGYTGDVYAHTGVITEYSTSGSDWKYVKTNWGQNTPDTKLTRIGQDLYSLDITPDIRSYYGVPANEQILKMAFVFRSDVQVGGSYLEGKTETFGDIFIDVYEAGLSVAFAKPSSFPIILEMGDTLEIEANANEADSVFLYLNDNLLKKEAGNSVSDTVVADTYGNSKVKAIAANQAGMVTDSFFYFVRTEVAIEPLPAGIRDGINYIDAQTVVLCLFAPYKNFVFVIGDFNDWGISGDYYMKMTPDSSRYWLQVNGLVPGQEYIFQYFIDGTLKVGDPYADKISDPWNDKYISNATYPGLIQYPTDKTTGIATVLQTNQPSYNWQVENFPPPSVTDLVIYELLVRDFTSKHSYAAIVDSLDYLRDAGINAVELMPVNEFEGNSSWGYNPSFYFAPDKYYGPKNELKRLVDECHKRGIAVIMDITLNHAYDQCVFVRLYFDGDNPTAQNPWFNVHSNFTNPDAQWGNDFNHESPYTQALVDSINSYWMSEYKMDGFRFDFTKGFSNTPHGSNDPWGSNYDATRIAILERMADQIWVRKPGALVIFEHLADNSEEKVLADHGILLWGNMAYNYEEAAMGYHDGGKSNFSGISYKQRNWNEPNLVGYMESHDEERVAFKCITYGNALGDYNIKDTTTTLRRLAMNALFFFTVPGPKMIWQFGELGYDYSIDYNGRLGEKPVRWDYYNDYRRKYLYDLYSALIDLKKAQPVFETTDFTLTVLAPLKKIILRDVSMNVVILGNFDVKAGIIEPTFPHLGTWYDYFTGEPYEVTDLAANFSLEAGEYHLFTDVQLPVPEIGTDIPELSGDELSLQVYPNPGFDFNIHFRMDKPGSATLNIFDLSGRNVARIFNGYLVKGDQDIRWSAAEAGLSNGLYLLEIRTPNQSEARRLMVHGDR